MKINDILREDEWENDDPTRQFVNPVPHSIPSGTVFDLYDKIGIFFRKKHNIKGFTEETKAQMDKILSKVSTIENVPINQIVASEKYLSGVHINSLQNKEKVIKSSEHPVLLKYGNKYMVADGNHRITAAHLHKETEIAAEVFDVIHIAKQLNITV